MTAEWFDVVYTKFCVIRSGGAGVLLLTFDAGASGAKQSVVVPVSYTHLTLPTTPYV